MWARNLLFIGLILGGAAALTALLFPPSTPPRVHHFDAQEFQAAEFRSGIAQLRQNQSLLEQQLNSVREEDLDQYLLNNGTLLGRRAATFDDTRGAFPAVELPRRRALGPRTSGGRR